MGKGRLEAFSDGVIAIIITIMVLELKAPEGAGFANLAPLLPVFLSYLLSFVFVGIYWNNHHHMLHAAGVVSGAALWANLHLLVWLSLVPFVTAWMDENHFQTAPVATYGFVLSMAGLAYYILERALIHCNDSDGHLARAVGDDWKTILSVIAYGIAIAAAFWLPLVAMGVYVLVAALWLIPDRRIESQVAASGVRP